MKIVIKLPGAGLIGCNNSEKSELAWLSYRDYKIDFQFYVDLFSDIEKNNKDKLFIVSGGVGSHLYTKLAEDLACAHSFRKYLGISCVKLIQETIMNYAADRNSSVFNRLITIDEAKNIAEKSQKNIFFIEPTKNANSTDSLATMLANDVNADKLIFFKAKAPVYFVGFNEPTVIEQWMLSDLIERAYDYEKNTGRDYIVDYQSLLIIQSSKIKSFIYNPYDCKGFLKDDMVGSFTEIIYDCSK